MNEAETRAELNQDKLKPLLLIKYHNSIQDAVADLGKPEEIGRVFSRISKIPLHRTGGVKWTRLRCTTTRHGVEN